MESTNETEHEKTVFFRNKSPWWKHRLSTHCRLSCIVIIAFLICSVFAFIMGKMSSNGSGNCWRTVQQLAEHREKLNTVNPHDDTCFEQECIHSASWILKRMDYNVKPCDNFYKFACGRFLSSTIIPDDKGRVTTFTIVDDKLDEQLRTSIEEKSEPNEPKSLKLARNLYKSCMNIGRIEARGLKPLQETLEKLGGWPVIYGNAWNETSFDWKTATYKFRDLGHSTNNLIRFKIVTDPKNGKKHAIALDDPILGFPRTYLTKGLNDKSVDAYYNYMVDIAVILGASKYHAVKELRESLLFEIELAKMTLPKENRRDATQLYNPINLTELTMNYPGIHWRVYFNRLLPLKINVDDDDLIILVTPRYIADFLKLIAVTPKRIQANYMMWRVTESSITYINDQARSRQLAYSKALSGRTNRVPRWNECVKIVAKSLAMSVGAMYVKKYFDEEAKTNSTEMVMNIKQQFKETLKQVKWLDEETRKRALEKLAAMTNHIGYPDELLNEKKLEKFFDNLELTEDHYFENILNLRMFSTEFNCGMLRKPVDKRDWIRHGESAVVNAFYEPIENSIRFPAGILQSAFFNKNRPRYMNYGGIGFIMGHEITHGFDDKGSQFDKDGNLFDWWKPTTKECYLKHARCIVNQYGNYTVHEVGLNINGINTQGENIADNGGLKGSYLAYDNWVKRNKPEKKLPGLPYTPRQMFWITAATTWCAKYTVENLKLRVSEDSHSPAEFRILGTLSNMPEFSRDFHCPIGSAMNPEKKCTVW